jgi:hypothetical protein
VPFNVLLLPLLGGYLFITHWNRTRFHTKRYSGERLIFHSAIAGVVFLEVQSASLFDWKAFRFFRDARGEASTARTESP